MLEEPERFTSAPGAELFPSFSPDGTLVAYACAVGGDWNVYVVRLDDGTVVNLTADSPADDSHPAFSPDGRSIAFSSDRGGEAGGIYVMSVTGESVRRLTASGYHPDWSPDGGRIVYATGEPILDPSSPSRHAELRVVTVVDGDDRLLHEGDATQPRWSPNGHRIAFWSRREGYRNVYTLAEDGGGRPLAITRDEHTNWSPAWSADGAWVYFSSDRGGAGELWRVAVDELSGGVRGDLEPVAAAPAAEIWHAAFSADGRRGAYATVRSTTNLQLLALDEGGRPVGGPTWVTRFDGHLRLPDVSAEGLLAYQVGHPGDLEIRDVDGELRTRLTEDRYRDTWPRWSPDGELLAFSSDRGGGGFEVWTVRRDGSRLRQLTFMDQAGGAGDGLRPVWSPDGSRLAFDSGSPDDPSARLIDPTKAWAEQRVESIPPAEGVSRFRAHSWSPDGARLAGVGEDEAGRGVYVVSLADASYELVARAEAQAVRWLNDSRTLLFVDRRQTIRGVDTLTGETWTVLALAPDSTHGLAPEALGGSLYFERTVREADLWSARLTGSPQPE